VIRVLYADDEPSLLEITRLYLERTGEFSVDTVESASEGLTRLKTGQYDVILSDYQMPGMDGIRFLRQIRADGNTIPFIVFTGRGREDVVIDAIDSGADSYIQKGGNPQAQFAELAHKITQIVRRYQAERKVREGAARFRALFENIWDIIQIFDKTGRVVYNSPSAYRIMGFPENEPLYFHANNALTYIHPDDREGVVARYREIGAAAGSSQFMEYRMKMAGGDYLWLESVFTNKYDVDGIHGLIVTSRPITERKRAEEELKKKHEELNAAFEQLTATEEELRQNYNELAGSEHRLAESERLIRASEAYLKCIISDAREGLTAYDTDLRFTLWNPYMEELTGIPGIGGRGKTPRRTVPVVWGDPLSRQSQKSTGGRNARIRRYPGRAFDKKEKNLDPLHCIPAVRPRGKPDRGHRDRPGYHATKRGRTRPRCGNGCVKGKRREVPERL